MGGAGVEEGLGEAVGEVGGGGVGDGAAEGLCEVGGEGGRGAREVGGDVALHLGCGEVVWRRRMLRGFGELVFGLCWRVVVVVVLEGVWAVAELLVAIVKVAL